MADLTFSFGDFGEDEIAQLEATALPPAATSDRGVGMRTESVEVKAAAATGPARAPAAAGAGATTVVGNDSAATAAAPAAAEAGSSTSLLSPPGLAAAAAAPLQQKALAPATSPPAAQTPAPPSPTPPTGPAPTPTPVPAPAKPAKPLNWAALVRSPAAVQPPKQQPQQRSAAAAAAAAAVPAAAPAVTAPALGSRSPARSDTSERSEPPVPLPEEEWLAKALAALGPISKPSATAPQQAPAPAAAASAAGAAVGAAAGGRAPPAVAVRGMVNTGNTCYRLAVLQSLLACAPLAEALAAVPTRSLLGMPAAEAHVPTWMALAKFWGEFRPARSSALANARAVNPQDSLGAALANFRGAAAGEQEDAEEFLAFFLGKLHQEVERLVKRLAVDAESQAASKQAEVDDEWQEVGRGGVTANVNRQAAARAAAVESVVTRLFHGSLRSEVRRGRGPLSVMVEPFLCLQLPVPPPEAGPSHPQAPPGGRGGPRGGPPPRQPTRGSPPVPLQSLLAAFFGGEVVEGVSRGGGGEGGGGRGGGGGRAQRSCALESLPRVLTLHLKQYVFHRGHGTATRTGRAVAYPMELRVPDAHLGAAARADAARCGRGYRLFAVVLHYGAAGASAASGHYTALVRRGGSGGGAEVWHSCDDRIVTEVDEADVLSPPHRYGAAPYLLFYERQLSPAQQP